MHHASDSVMGKTLHKLSPKYKLILYAFIGVEINLLILDSYFTAQLSAGSIQ